MLGKAWIYGYIRSLIHPGRFRAVVVLERSVHLDTCVRDPSPRVSVIMATYNGSQFIRQSVNSILAQTLHDFELVITDDCSTDDTGAILDGIVDTRVRVLRNTENKGVVWSRNRCLAAARGQYIAMLDHDDLSRPTRLAKQVAYLDMHSSTVLVGTAAHTLSNGVLAPTRHPVRTSPAMIRWLLHIANPLVCSSIMVRTSAVRQLGTFMREDYKYADDYDLYHRLMVLGDVARLDEPLTIYRLHATNSFRRHEDVMHANAVKVLAPAYRPWFGDNAERAAFLVVNHLAAGRPVPDASTLVTIQEVFEHLNSVCATQYEIGDTDLAAIKTYADGIWRRMMRGTASGGVIQWRGADNLPSGQRFSAGDLAHLALSRMPLQKQAKRLVRRLQQHSPVPPAPVRPGRLFNIPHQPLEADESCPPRLFVVVDTEAEFNWEQPFARNLTKVTAMNDVERGQAVFDEYGLRPIYVVDFPIASQSSSVSRLRAMLDRDACYIGAHLHPWTTPPFKEELSSLNSYPGNLTAELEEQKLICLLDTIRERFGVSPMFYKAGRYGIGPATAETLARHGIKVDLSVMPGTNLTGQDGPDFRALDAVPYWAADGKLLMLPMTRSSVGLTPSLSRISEAVQQAPGLRWLQMKPVLSRLRLANIITLTPEGVTAAEQIRLIKSMLHQGRRLFVMHYHSPSLSPGHTSYVRTAEDAAHFIQRIRDVCRFFFEELGGMPGYPPDLLEMTEHRESVVQQPILSKPARAAELLVAVPG